MFRTSNGNSCILIAIEGPDRLGKETQAKMLETALIKEKIKTTVEEVPVRDGVTHSRIYEMLHDGSALQYPVVFQTLQGTNRRYFQHKILPNLTAHHDVIVLDRWNLSTYVYGEASNVSVKTTEAILEGIVRADLTLVFDGAPFPKDNLDSYEANNAFQQRVRELYQGYCELRPQAYVKIDASRSREEVHADVLRHALACCR